MIDHWSFAHISSTRYLKALKKFSLKGINNHDLCHTSAVLYKMSYQINRELTTQIVGNKLFQGLECK